MDALRAANDAGVVLGLKSVADVANRLDIDDLLLNKPDAFNLFLLAFAELQEPQYTTDKMGFYQIAGIHGLPSVAWDGVKTKAGKGDGSGNFFAGYCTHSKPSFPSWHRPYLSMLEQTIYAKMAEIVERYPEASKDKYRAALKEFRLPYWDYFRPRAQRQTVFNGITSSNGQETSFAYDFMMPEILTADKVMVRQTSDDKLTPIDNPLRRLAFPSQQSGGFGERDVGNALKKNINIKNFTVRYPQNADDVDGRPDIMNAELNNVRESNVTSILDMVQDYDNYESFASDSQTPGAAGNLESVHGGYHVSIGGDGSQGAVGWMSAVWTAAFDPVFWLHHCNIDRYAAIWQAAHPQRWFYTDNGLKYAAGDAIPFRKTKTSMWKIDEARYTDTFGYTYADALGSAQDVVDRFVSFYEWASSRSQSTDPPPEMAPLPYLDGQAFQYNRSGSLPGSVGPVLGNAPQVIMKTMEKASFAVTSTITRAVAAVAPAQAEAVSKEEIPKAEPAEVSANTIDTSPVQPGQNSSPVAFTNMPSNATDVEPANVDDSKYFRDWYIDNVVQKMAFRGPFTVYYFIGPFEDNVAAYSTQPTKAGMHHIFASTPELCDNCGEQEDDYLLVTDTAVITPLLKDYVKTGQLNDLTPASVVPFLAKNLKWRVVTLEGVKKDPRNTAGFKIGVSSKLSPRDRSTGDRPLYSEYPQIIDTIVNAASTTHITAT